MIDVGSKSVTERQATAGGKVVMQPATFSALKDAKLPKGDALSAARVAGIMAAKETHRLIPMCHPLNITHVIIDFYPDNDACSFRIESAVRIFDKTGVEMEALTAVSVAALTIYDMCKSYDRGMTISDIYLLKKSGGKSGIFIRKK